MGGFVQIFKDFSNWSTVAGVPHIANANTKISRIFWIVVFVIMVGMFIYELYIMIAKYLSFPASVTTEILFEEQPFPVVTICNMNPYKYATVKSNGAFTQINSLMEVYKKAVANTSFPPDKYGLYTTKNEQYDRDSLAADALVLESALLTDAQKTPAMYSYSDLIQDCTFSGRQCSKTDFTSYVHPVYGACYSFNEDKSLNYSTNREGILYGLKLMVTVSQTKPSGTYDYLPTTQLAGARVTVATRGSRPSLEANGVDVGVGYQTAIAIVLNFTYTLETCFNGCKQRDTVKQCSCANPRLAKGASDVWCSPTQANLNCLQRLKGDQANVTNPNIDILTDCGCNAPCNEATYQPTASLAKFPAKNYFVATDSVNGVGGSCDSNNTKFATKSDCQAWYAQNGLIVQVFFETLSYELYTEGSSYGINDIINDLGGQAGLWLGLSVISIVELVGLFILIGAFCVSGGAIKIRPDDDDMRNDERIKDVEDVKNELDDMDKPKRRESGFSNLSMDNEKKDN